MAKVKSTIEATDSSRTHGIGPVKNGKKERAESPASPSDPFASVLVADRFGRAVRMLMKLPRYKYLSLGDLEWAVAVPLMLGQFTIMNAQRNDGGKSILAGAVIWAQVSDAVDEKIREQIKAAAHPVRLQPNEWRSGETIWILDVIAPSAEVAKGLLAELAKAEFPSSKKINAHPVIRVLLDRASKAKSAETAELAGEECFNRDIGDGNER